MVRAQEVSTLNKDESKYRFGNRFSRQGNETAILGRVGVGTSAGVKGNAGNLGIGVGNSQTTGFASNFNKNTTKISPSSFKKPGGVKPIIGF
ncbi:MAG: hypothetical protein Q7T79_00795 [bacterium]|nr:hypothetical protein [bacterium]